MGSPWLLCELELAWLALVTPTGIQPPPTPSTVCGCAGQKMLPIPELQSCAKINKMQALSFKPGEFNCHSQVTIMPHLLFPLTHPVLQCDKLMQGKTLLFKMPAIRYSLNSIKTDWSRIDVRSRCWINWPVAFTFTVRRVEQINMTPPRENQSSLGSPTADKQVNWSFSVMLQWSQQMTTHTKSLYRFAFSSILYDTFFIHSWECG